LAGIGPGERRRQAIQPAAGGQIVVQRLEQDGFRTELVVHSHAGDIGALRDGIDRERSEILGAQEITRGGDDSAAGFAWGFGLAAIGARAHHLTFARRYGNLELRYYIIQYV